MTILYQEKGVGLFDFLSEQGFSLYQLDGVWTASPPGNDEVVNALIAAYQPQPVPPSRLVSAVDFSLRFSVPESIAIRSSVDPIVKEWVRRLDDPRLLEVDLERQEVIDGINYLVSQSLLSEQRAAEILS